MHGTRRSRELPVEMELREGRDTARRFRVEITVEMPVNMVQHRQSLMAMTCSTDLAV
jgi:hypothetical protein